MRSPNRAIERLNYIAIEIQVSWISIVDDLTVSFVAKNQRIINRNCNLPFYNFALPKDMHSHV